jgi:hypothetical protein
MRSGTSITDFATNHKSAQSTDMLGLSPNSASLASPPLSPGMQASGRGAHRRGNSEFIGGDGKTGGLGLMSTSPTKVEGALPIPDGGAKAASRRRGHAHRRSAAISSHDLSDILKAPPTPRAGSAPASPLEPPPDVQALIAPQPESSEEKRLSQISQSSDTSMEGTVTRRTPKVQFRPSHEYEYISRPSSSLWSDTSSMTNTKRGHSVSGSMSSITGSLSSVSGSPSSRNRATTLETTFEDENNSRPSTAGAILGSPEKPISFFSGKRPSSACNSPGLSASSPVSPAFPPKKKHHFGLKRSSESEWESGKHGFQSPPFSPEGPRTGSSSDESSEVDHKRTLGGTSSSKPSKKHKVTSMAWSIISGKSKVSGRKDKHKPRRAATPPPADFYQRPSTGGFDFGKDLENDWENTSPGPALPRFALSNSPYSLESPATHSMIDLDLAQPQPPTRASRSEPDVSDLMIDLDEALEPLRSPPSSSSSPALDGGFGVAKRRMHSGGGTGAFTGPGLHYHRRTESAPAMAMSNFDNFRASFALNSMGSNSSMADVFEEEEEEEDRNLTPRPSSKIEIIEDENGLGIGIEVVEADNAIEGGGMDWSVDEHVPVRQTRSMAQEQRAQPEETYIQNDVIEEEVGPVEIADEVNTGRDSDSTINADDLMSLNKGKSVAADRDLPHPTPSFLTPDISSSVPSSNFPSPDLNSTFDEHQQPRTLTAASSFSTHPSFDSTRLGEPGPQFRMSVDDVPSLTSSNSTMTSAVQPPPGPNVLSYQREDRSRSVCSESGISPNSSFHPHPSKRSSLHSLSRFIGSSHGEKSKLSIEEKAYDKSDEPGAKNRNRWSKRISRLWKPSKDDVKPSQSS